MFNTHLGIPGIAELRCAAAGHGFDDFAEVITLSRARIGVAHALCQLAYFGEKTGVITHCVFGIFRLRDTPAEFRLKLIGDQRFRGGEQRASGKIALPGARFFLRLNDVRHADRVDFVARLHHFLLEVEENFGEPGLLLREREDGLIHHLQAKRGTDSLPLSIGHAKANTRVSSRLINGRIGRSFDL